MLRSAFNALTRLHSRPAKIKRLGSPDVFSACRITPSNFFRFLRGPEYTTIHGYEFIIPIDSMYGHFAQKISFSAIPDDGAFKLSYGASMTASLDFDATASEIQAELRLISGLENIFVTGSFLLGFTATFMGFDTEPLVLSVEDSTLVNGTDEVTSSVIKSYTKWNELIKKGDRIIDGNKQYSVDEIMEMYDIGATVMGVRVRCD